MHRQNADIEALREMAAWYRSWAEITGSAGERANRLALAEMLEQKAQNLADVGDRARPAG